MKKLMQILFTLMLIVGAFYLGSVNEQRMQLENNIIRLHVVADSNSSEDQNIKLAVRDAITERLNGTLEQFADLASAKEYLQTQLRELEHIANNVLQSLGTNEKAEVSLSKETFPRRNYDTFSLPAGVYESLRVTIGSGEGENWWCVVFPGLCVSATADDFEDVAAGAGFSNTLSQTLAGNQGYQVRFFLMDCLGWIENWLFSA